MNPYRYIRSKSIKDIISAAKRCDRLDLSPYANQGFNFEQLGEIAYAIAYLKLSPAEFLCFIDTSFTHHQLEIIFNGLKDNVNVALYAKTEFNHNQMREIYEGLKNGLDVTVYAKAEFDWYTMQQIRLAMETNHHEELFKFINTNNYTADQLREIRLGLEVDLSVDEYSNVEYSSELMRVLREGLEKGIRPDVYLEYYHKGFTTDQLAVIRDGFLAKVNVKLYANLTTPPEHMRTILNRLINMKK